MNPARQEKIKISLDDLLQLSPVYNLIESSIAILDCQGKVLFENQAFTYLTDLILDPDTFIHNKKLVFEHDSMILGLKHCVDRGADQFVNQTVYYSKQISVNITIMLRPIFLPDSDQVCFYLWRKRILFTITIILREPSIQKKKCGSVFYIYLKNK